MSWLRGALALSIGLVLALAVPPVAPSVSAAQPPPAPPAPGASSLAAASAALARGAGPAGGHPLTCTSIGTLSMGCAGTPSAGSAPRAGIGWEKLCSLNQCPPPARGGAGMAYDSATGNVVLFGGIINLTTNSGTTFSDTWIFHNGNWTQLSIPGPGARLGEYMAYDPVDGYVVMFGGGPYLTLNSSLYFDDTWVFSNDTWTQIFPRTSPTARGLGSLTWDPVDDYLVMYGGMTSQTDVHSDTWTFRGGQWTNLSLSYHPPPLLAPAVAWDPAGPYLLVFGGATPSASLEFGDDLEQTWAFSHGAWTNLTPTIEGTLPDGRVLSSLAYDPAQGYMVLFGGWNTTTGDLFGDTWIFLDGFWTELFLPDTPASAMIGGSMLSTSNSSGLFLFGGIVGNYADYAATNATWVFGPPPPDSRVIYVAAHPYTVSVDAAPTSCASVVFNGSSIATGSSALVTPGVYNVSAGSCPGYRFDGWFGFGSVTVVDPGSASSEVQIVGDGSITAYYEPTTTSTYQPQLEGLAGAGAILVALAVVVLFVRVRSRAGFRALEPSPPAPPVSPPPAP